MTQKTETPRKSFKMPHLLWIMMGLLIVASLATYVIPAGQFGLDAQGALDGTVFNYLGSQTPVNLWEMLLLILPGFTGSSAVICTVLSLGAMTAVVLATGAFDDVLNYAIFKLKDKGEALLISGLFVLMVYLGSFGGSDALIAVVPIGVIFCKKMKLDPICAVGVTTYATLIGFGTGPTKQYIAQLMMGVPMYHAFFTMFISMNFFMVVGLFFLLRYVKKIRQDPTQSPMWSQGWNPETMEVDAADQSKLGGAVDFPRRAMAIVAVFMFQYVIIVGYTLSGGTNTQALMVALAMLISVICGVMAGFSAERIGNEFVKGLQSMVFVCFVIGLARVMSLVMTNGNILHTIVYSLTRPLMDLPRSVASVGMTAIISVINIVIPSATSKAAILIPIIRPIAETLQMNPDLAVQAFQYGDGFTNIVSPFLGWTIGSCAMAGVPFPTWVRWALPKVVAMILLGFCVMFLLTESGWTAF